MTHYEYNIKDEEVEILKQLYSQPLSLKQIQVRDQFERTAL